MRAVHKTKAELAYEQLREAILKGDIGPGERLTTRGLSELLGMSSTPIREAIRRLEAEGVLSNEPHFGVAVVDLSEADADEIYLLRAPMESLATRLAVARLSEADIAELEAIHRRLDGAYRSGDDPALIKLNAKWHLRLYSVVDKRHVLRLIEQLWMPFHGSTPLWLSLLREQSWLQKQTVDEHAEMMEAIRARDAELAAGLMHEHITHVHVALLAHFRAVDPGSGDADAAAAGV